MMLDAMRIKMRSMRLGVPKDKLLWVPKDKLLKVEARGTKGQVAGGGGYGVPKDKLLEVEARGTKGQIAGGGG